MKNWIEINKVYLQRITGTIGLLCLIFTVVGSNKSFKEENQELIFWIAIVGIISLAAFVNLKLKTKNDAQLSFINRNSPLLLVLIAAAILVGFWIENNYL